MGNKNLNFACLEAVGNLKIVHLLKVVRKIRAVNRKETALVFMFFLCAPYVCLFPFVLSSPWFPVSMSFKVSLTTSEFPFKKWPFASVIAFLSPFINTIIHYNLTHCIWLKSGNVELGRLLGWLNACQWAWGLESEFQNSHKKTRMGHMLVISALGAGGGERQISGAHQLASLDNCQVPSSSERSYIKK